MARTFPRSMTALVSPLRTASLMEILLSLTGYLRRLRVREESMLPTLAPGEVILINPRAYRQTDPSPGDLIVAQHPVMEHLKIVKRVLSVDNQGLVYLLSDNSTLPHSQDSRNFGALDRSQVVGQVLSKLPGIR